MCLIATGGSNVRCPFSAGMFSYTVDHSQNFGMKCFGFEGNIQFNSRESKQIWEHGVRETHGLTSNSHWAIPAVLSSV